MEPFTGADVKEMWEAGFLPVDLLDPVAGTEKCRVPGCTDFTVYCVGFPNFCYQDSLAYHAKYGNPGADEDPFNGGPYIRIADR